MSDKLERQAFEWKKKVDAAYSERNEVVLALVHAAMALGRSAWLGLHNPDDLDWDPDWTTIVFIDLPSGQVSWHLHKTEVPHFEFLPCFQPSGWDGHDTPEKYRRLRAWVP